MLVIFYEMLTFQLVTFNSFACSHLGILVQFNDVFVNKKSNYLCFGNEKKPFNLASFWCSVCECSRMLQDLI